MKKNLMVSLSIQTGIKTLKNVEKLTFTQLLNLFLQYYSLEHMFDHDKVHCKGSGSVGYATFGILDPGPWIQWEKYQP